MTKIILPRRKFLSLAPAIVLASNLMPVHSIALTLEPEKIRDFDYMIEDPISRCFRHTSLEDYIFWGRLTNGQVVRATPSEIVKYSNKFPHFFPSLPKKDLNHPCSPKGLSGHTGLGTQSLRVPVA